MNNSKKLKELLEKKAHAQEKLDRLLKRFRGVVHESSVSEMRYADIKVLEDYLKGISKEIENLENSKGR